MYISLPYNDRIEGWTNNEDESAQPSANMLRILENQIINSVKLQQRLQSQSNKKFSEASRPATVRVRPTTSKNPNRQILQSYPTVHLYNSNKDEKTTSISNKTKLPQSHEQKRKQHIKQRTNKQIKIKDPIRQKNKENAYRSSYSQKTKGQQFLMKKQSLIFTNNNSLKTRKNINNFHEMEIKMRKCRQFNHRIIGGSANQYQNFGKENVDSCTPLHSGRKKQDAYVVEDRKGNQLKIGCCLLQFNFEENHCFGGFEKLVDGQYAKLSARKQKMLAKDKEVKKRDYDSFTDAHLAEPKGS